MSDLNLSLQLASNVLIVLSVASAVLASNKRVAAARKRATAIVTKDDREARYRYYERFTAVG
jgi:hypothetical protein